MFRTALAALALLGLATAAAAQQITVTDLAGREVTLPRPAARIILGEGRFLPALAILDRADPTERLIGTMGEYERLDPAGYAQYVEKFPKLKSVLRIGHTSSDSFSVERAIALEPDLAIFGVEGHGPGARSAEVIAQLTAAGVLILFVDFRREPIAGTEASLALLGRVLGRQKEADEFLGVYRAEMARVADRLAAAKPPRPKVFLESRVGLSDQCCESMGRGMLARFIELAGGENMAAAVIPGAVGTVSIEYLLERQPDIYVGTGIGSAQPVRRDAPVIALGADASPADAKASFARALSRKGIAELEAVKTGLTFGIWHHFYNSPLNVAAVQAMAKALHPGLFADLDADATLRMLYARFQPVPLAGTYWVSGR